MDLKTKIRDFTLLTLLAVVLSACGGVAKTVDNSTPSTPTTSNIASASDGSITINGTAEANSTVTIIFPDGSQKITTADASGNYSLTSAPLQPSGNIKITSTDTDGNKSEPANVSSIASYDTIKANYLATGIMPELIFKPSLGINTEAPQGGADTAGMPMPFVDIFRTARPFKESQRIVKIDSKGNIVYETDDKGKYITDANGNKIKVYTQNLTTYDENGWPMDIDLSKRSVQTKILQGALKNSIPEGKYSFIYEGTGTLEFSPHSALSGSGIKKIPNENKYLLDIKLHEFNDPENEQETSSKNQLSFGIKDISSGSYIKNIRVIMPGGTCTGNPFIRIDETDTCPSGTQYQSFESRLRDDRNAIIFNPDYLMFLRNFKVIRMMNLMEASLKKLCYTKAACPAGVGTWDHRAKIDDAVWGGNDGRTSDENHKGVPVEVMIALANTLKRDIWVNMPHVANDEYITQYAKQVYAELDPSIKVYLEYSNEVWNSGFAGHSYATSQGNALNLGAVPNDTQQYCNTLTPKRKTDNVRCHADYYSRLRFYSQRAVEIFKLWKTEFSGSNTRLVRVLGSFIGDRVLTQRMLEHVVTNDIDAVAIAPYFFGCPYQERCKDAPKTLLTATTVDDIFAAIDQAGDIDVKSLNGTINAVKNQLTITSQFGLKLVSYEGGQHLVTGVLGKAVAESDKPRLRKLFNKANRDPRMKDRYIKFLNAWKDLSDDGTTLFTLYTIPQSFYRYGNFGIKEHLNKPRSESPKFDGAMTFQEVVGQCWWDGCDF